MLMFICGLWKNEPVSKVGIEMQTEGEGKGGTNGGLGVDMNTPPGVK